jgi:hypothetical protein
VPGVERRVTSAERQTESVQRAKYPLALGHVGIMALDVRHSTFDRLRLPQASLGPSGGGFSVSRGQVVRPNGT